MSDTMRKIEELQRKIEEHAKKVERYLMPRKVAKSVQRENEIKRILKEDDGTLTDYEKLDLIEELNELHRKEAERLIRM